MDYGYSHTSTKVLIAGSCVPQEHKNWARTHKSIGIYSYQMYGVFIDSKAYVKWLFSNPEDAVLFALKFK